jgi:hypothetical protein
LIRFARREGKPSSKSTALLKPSINYQGWEENWHLARK